MSYLFIDKWGDNSILVNYNRRNTTHPLFLLLATIIKEFEEVFFVSFNDVNYDKQRIIDLIIDKRINKIVVYADVDNLNSIQNSELLQHYNKLVNLYIFSINTNFKCSHDNFYDYITFNEREDINSNIIKILKHLNLKHNKRNWNNTIIDYSLVKQIKGETFLITVGTGCNRKCSFCNIANSIPFFRNCNLVIEEITFLLRNGANSFHIINHSFCENHSYIKIFCESLLSLKNKYDFGWSFFGVPSLFIHNLNLLPLMINSNLKKVELSCESGSQEVLHNMNIYHTNDDIKKIINVMVQQKVSLIGVHFIIGTSKESLKTLDITMELIRDILELSSSLADIYLNAFFPEDKPHQFDCDTILAQRTDFILDSEYMTKSQLKLNTLKIKEDIKKLRSEYLANAPLEVQYKHFYINKFNMESQIYKSMISKMFRNVFFMRKVFYKNVFFSWEIEHEIEEYTPILNFAKHIQHEELKADYSNINIIILNLIKRGMTVKELISNVEKITLGVYGKKYTISFLKELEEKQQFVYYIKYLN